MRRVVITGLGAITPVGRTPRDAFCALVQARSGIQAVSDSVYSGPSALAVAAIDFDPSAHWSSREMAQLDRATQLALVAGAQAVSDAALPNDARENAGVYWGTGLGGANSIEDAYRQLYAGSGRVRPTAVVLGMTNAAAGHLSIAHGMRGPVLVVSTACSSSASSVGEAYRAIKGGYADAILAGGSESLLTLGNLKAWDAMQALARRDAVDASRSCKPFSANRTGIVLGEGAAALMLESAEHARARGARVYAEIIGYGNAADAHGMSKPSADGQARAMRAALRDARIAPSDVQYLNAHGTATTIGDRVETAAIKAVFGDYARQLPVSSTKALHGHLMGATGALEIMVTVLAIEKSLIPPTAHFESPDPECDLDYVPNVAREAQVDVAMSNSFGFGGMNAVIVARRYHEGDDVDA